MGACCGVDNASMLPPFVSGCRNSDGIFGEMVLSCCEDLLFAFVPHAMLHAPVEVRHYRLGAVRTDGAVTRFSDLVLPAMQHAPL
jgi:hypothetical protein